MMSSSTQPTPSKADLLAKACDREPTKFHQIDCWITEALDDDVCDSDVRLQPTVAYELMYGADVRVLIRPDLDRESRLRLLRKILNEERKIEWEDLERPVAGTKTHKVEDKPAARRDQKRLLLEERCGRSPRRFHQVDAWTDDPFDGLLDSKIDNRITSTVTHELMDGADLRVLMRPGLDGATRFELIQRIVEFERVVDWEEENDLVAPNDLPRICTTEIESEQGEMKAGDAQLIDRLELTTTFLESRGEEFRLEALRKPEPDYGTFLKDGELIELYPEAADSYHVDDVRRALMMIRMILDYGEASFTVDEGDAVHTLLWCILGEEDICLDGTWSANNPVARREKARVRAAQTTSVDLDDDDFALDEEPAETPPPINTLTSGGSGYQVPKCFEDNSLSVRTLVPDAERRLEHLLSMLESDEFRYYTCCFSQPEELEVVLSVGAWLLGIDPPSYSTERVLNAFRSVWDLVRASDQRLAEASGGES